MSKELEALEKLYCAGNLLLDYVISDKHKEDYISVKQALLKAQEQEKAFDDLEYENKMLIKESVRDKKIIEEQEKVLKILFEKNVDIEYLNKCNDVKVYNVPWCDPRCYLTQEEFDTLKRYSNGMV